MRGQSELVLVLEGTISRVVGAGGRSKHSSSMLLMRMMTMLDRLAELYVRSRPGLCERYARHIISVSRRCTKAIDGRVESLAIAGWLSQELEQHSSATVAGYRRMICAVLRWALEEGLLDKPIRLPKIRVNRRDPEAWTMGEFTRLLATAESVPGQIGGVPAGLWWRTLLEVLYWTGARVGSVLALAVDDWDSNRRVLFLRNGKSRRVRVYSIPDPTASRLTELAAYGNERLFFWPKSRAKFFVHLRGIVEKAGIRYRPGAFGLTHRIRRTVASYLWRTDPRAAQRLLDHSSPEVTYRHYVDPSVVGETESVIRLLPRPDTEQLALPFPWG